MIKSDRSPSPEQSERPPSPPSSVQTVQQVSQDVQKNNNVNMSAVSNKDRQQDHDMSLDVPGNKSKEDENTSIIGKENVSNKRNRRNKDKAGHRTETQHPVKKTGNKDSVKPVTGSSRKCLLLILNW